LMEKQAQMAQARAVQSHIMSTMEPQPGVSGQGAPVAGAPVAGAPGAGTGVLRSGAPRQAPFITERHVQEAMAIDPSGKLAQQYRDLMKLLQDDIITVGDLPYSRSQKVFFPGDPNKPVKVDLGKYIGVREIPRWLYEEWVIVHNHSVQKNDPWIEINWGISRNLIEGHRGKPGENLPLTVTQRAASDAATLEENKELAKKSAESIDALYASALQSYDIISLSKEAIGLAEKNPNAFKLMQNADVRTEYDTFLQAVQSGVQTPWGGFTLPGLVISKHSISPGDYAVIQKFAQIEAAFSLMNRRTWLKGTGAVSNMETQLAAQLGPMSTDRPEVIRMKAEAVALKAEFEINASNAFTNWKEKNPSKRFNSFLGSEDYKNIRNDYDKKMESVFESNQRVFDAMRGQGNPPPAPPGAGNPPPKPSGPPAAASNANRPKSLVEKLEDARRQAEDARKRQAERDARGGQ